MAAKLKLNTLSKEEFVFPKKKPSSRPLKVYFLIVSEGKKSEPDYFRSFPTINTNYEIIITLKGTGTNTQQVVEQAIQIRDNSIQKFDSVWAVFDKDDFPAHKFDNAINKSIENNIKPAWSNESFELWFLLHFDKINLYSLRGKYSFELEKVINKQMNIQNPKTKTVFEYSKSLPVMYDILQKYGSQKLAIQKAQNLNLNFEGGKYPTFKPCTQVHLLVEELNGSSGEFNKNILANFNKGV